MTRTVPRPATLIATAVLALGLSACGGTATSSGTAPAAGPAATASADGGTTAEDDATAEDDTDDDADDTAAADARVSANTASEDEIAAALEAAGVGNPERWAEEVVEYRPYPADDPNLTKLRDNLAKYNPGQETTDKIVSALTP